MEHFLWETNLKEIVENKWEAVQVELLRQHICECFLLLLTIHSRQSKCRVVFLIAGSNFKETDEVRYYWYTF